MRIVIDVALDHDSMHAARWVVDRLAPGGEHLLVHVLDASDPEGDRPHREVPERAEAGRRLEELRDELGSGVSVELREGRRHEVLVEACREWEADLLAIADAAAADPVGGEASEDDARERAARRILRHASLPLLIVRPTSRDAPRHVLAAVDDSDETATVLAWARAVRERTGAKLTVAHVFHPSFAGVARLVSGAKTGRNVEPQQREQTRSWLEEEVREAGIDLEEVTLEVGEGDPAKAILAMEDRMEPDLLVLGSRGAGGVEETLVGSVASSVARSASASVLITRRTSDRTGGPKP